MSKREETPGERRTAFHDAMMIAAIEAQYWGNVDDPRLLEISMGAMGAAANICAALARNLTPDEYRKETERRA